MTHKRKCAKCRDRIPMHAWICPNCLAWVGEVTRFEKRREPAVRFEAPTKRLTAA